LATTAWAEDKAAAPAQNANQAQGTKQATTAPLSKEAILAQAVRPIKGRIASAEKQLEMYSKEMARPEKDRNLQAASDYQKQAAQYYGEAVLKARSIAAQFKNAEDKQVIVDQYEKPALEKAIGLYLQMAGAAMALPKKNTVSALAFYKEILNLDPDNAIAKQGIKDIHDAAHHVTHHHHH
jgi:hypothetical protein